MTVWRQDYHINRLLVVTDAIFAVSLTAAAAVAAHNDVPFSALAPAPAPAPAPAASPPHFVDSAPACVPDHASAPPPPAPDHAPASTPAQAPPSASASTSVLIRREQQG